MRAVVLILIRWYQLYISPYKGFCCAYRFRTGRASCSVLGARAVRCCGVFAGWRILRRRLYLCGVAHRRYASEYIRPYVKQRGDCDCSLPDINDLDCGCEFLDCGSCDWPTRKKDSKHEKSVYLPPQKKL